jgi:hypothetical protein
VISEAPYKSKARILLPLLFLSSFVALCSCQESGAFGLTAQGLASLLSGKDLSPVLALDEAALGDTGAYGPSAYYYLGRWLDSRDSPSSPSPEAAARAILLYRRAFERAQGLFRREAGLALFARLSSSGLWEELLAFSQDYREALGPEWGSERPCLEALDALGRFGEASALVARLSSAYPAEASGDGDALAYFAASADLHAGGRSWAKTLRRLLLERPGSDWTERAAALCDAEPRVRSLFSPEELHAIAMRVGVRRKNYGPAYKEALLAPEAAMGRSASASMIADAGRAFLYGGALKEGEARFTARGWTARYYRARFARSLEKWAEAALLFKKSAADAPSRADADAARWYSAECSYRAALEAAGALSPSGVAGDTKAGAKTAAQSAAEAAARARALDELVADSALWRGPETFADLANGLFRDALAARDWRLVAAMALRLAPALQSELFARIAYTAARAYELDLDPSMDPDGSEPEPEKRAAAAAVRFAAIADEPGAPLHYRALAAWRAGIEPSFVLQDLDTPSPGALAAGPESISSTEAFIAGFASFGLGDLGVA